MTKKQKKALMTEIVAELESLYPEALCALEWGGEDGWRLMVMGRLSAQCTDKRVNEVCKVLFEKYPTVDALASASVEDIGEIVKPCGLWRTKAANIKAECELLCEKYGGIVPDDMDELLKFPGVGRKIANLLLGDLYSRPAIVADTHCIRICGRFGMYPTSTKDAHKVEKVLVELVEPEKQSDFCHRIVMFGRDVCTARSPKCDECPISWLCEYKSKNGKK